MSSHTRNSHTKVMVAMSGGVDSSVAALLLKQQGYDVKGFFVKNWDYGIEGSECPARIEFEDAKKVGKLLGIEVIGKNFVKEYKERVFDYFIKQLKKGHTPNPDILCNREMKFKIFLDYINSLGYEFLATGHYAKISKYKNQLVLSPPKDNNKNQTYFLHTLNQKQLSKSIFPLSNLCKDEVRAIAREHNLPISDKKDSVGICFIGKMNFANFIKDYIELKSGDIVNEHGKIIGKHKGLGAYTIGQRKGIGIGGGANESGNAWYVAKKNVENNTLMVVDDKNSPYLLSKRVKAKDFMHPGEYRFEVGDYFVAQVRYRQKPQKCKVVEISDDASCVVVEFYKPQRAVTIGQYLVLYTKDDGYCLGGGEICEASFK